MNPQRSTVDYFHVMVKTRKCWLPVATYPVEMQVKAKIRLEDFQKQYPTKKFAFMKKREEHVSSL
jgi:hypothetical protein